MAKQVVEEKKAKLSIAERRNTNPENALRSDWPKLHRQLASYITMKGKVRNGIGLKEQKIARNILKDYGFGV